eukprot:1773722-Rhodomonas_salina.2
MTDTFYSDQSTPNASALEPCTPPAPATATPRAPTSNTNPTATANTGEQNRHDGSVPSTKKRQRQQNLDDGASADGAAAADDGVLDDGALADACLGPDHSVLAEGAALRERDASFLVDAGVEVLVGGVAEEVDVGHQRVAPPVDDVTRHWTHPSGATSGCVGWRTAKSRYETRQGLFGG